MLLGVVIEWEEPDSIEEEEEEEEEPLILFIIDIDVNVVVASFFFGVEFLFWIVVLTLSLLK